MRQGPARPRPTLAGGGKESHLRARLPPPTFRGASRSGGRGGASLALLPLLPPSSPSPSPSPSGSPHFSSFP